MRDKKLCSVLEMVIVVVVGGGSGKKMVGRGRKKIYIGRLGGGRGVLVVVLPRSFLVCKLHAAT